ncbi:MAG: helix-turn-helix domain-containing protein [Prevotellaceae bacterium]|nr:helix-turn-helix domain-containing protein [Prevotellaceae bacterium]
MKALINIHIGSIIKKEVEKRNISKIEFADMIGYHRTSVYDIFRRKSLDIELLIRISKALNYDFIHKVYFLGTEAQEVKTEKNEPQIFVGRAITPEEMKKMDLPKDFFVVVKASK